MDNAPVERSAGEWEHQSEPLSEDERQDDVEVPESDEDGEDLLNEDMQQDYRAIPELDVYEAEGIDENADEVLDEAELMAARRAADEELDRRDGGHRRRRRLPNALDELDDFDEDAWDRRRRRRRTSFGAAASDEPQVAIDIEEVRGRTNEWIAQDQVSSEIKRRFRHFLKTFEEDGVLYYVQKIKEMQSYSKKSLELQYNHLSRVHPIMAIWLADSPKLMLELFSAAAREVVLQIFDGTEEAYQSKGTEFEVYVRIANLSIIDKIRDLRNYHLNGLVRVRGVVTRRTGVFPQLRLVKYDCAKCGYVLGPFTQSTEQEVKPNACPNCNSKGPFLVNASETVYRDYQKVLLQESPGTVPAGRLPRQKEVILLHDLIDCARPGEEIDVTGTYINGYDASLNVKNSFPVFSTHIEANYVRKHEDIYSIYSLMDEDKSKILALAKDPRIGQRIIKSIAPSIYGHEFIKTGLAMALFGGQEKHPSPAYRLRGDINMLLLGDPGVAKSQFLKYIEKAAMRAVYTTGKGASAVGLTAAVHRDPITKEWTLEGGALVLADKGVCLIDEFDKMNEQDRVSIHEAMEQQSISISKAGIVTQLQARCSVIAAANPIGGRYDPSKNLAENVELSDPILSRFDILCVVRDQVDPVQDQRLAEFVVGNHMRSHPNCDEQAHEAAGVSGAEADPDIIPQDLLRKYLTYAKQNCRPQLQQADYDRIMEVYSKLRAEAGRSHGMPIAVRHLESLIRMSEAHARMHLREYVSDDDINMAIRMLVGSFIQTQKYSVHKTLEKRFKRYLTFGTDFHQLLLNLLRDLLHEEQRSTLLMGLPLADDETYRIPLRSLEEKAREHEVGGNLKDFLTSQLFLNSGFQLHPSGSYITYKAY